MPSNKIWNERTRIKMTNSKEIRIEAKTVEAAIVMACVKLGVTQENIEYEVLKQPKTGLMSIFGGKAEIKAWPRKNGGHSSYNEPSRRGGSDNRQGAHREKKNSHSGQVNQSDTRRNDRPQRGSGGGADKNEKQMNGQDRGDRGPQNHRRREQTNHQPREAREAREPRPERVPPPPLSPEVAKEVEIEIRNFCMELCERIAGESVSVSTTLTEERLQVEIDNPTISAMIKDQNKFVESLEHLLRKKPKHLKQDLPFRIFVDGIGARKGREEEIARVAKEKADQVSETGQKIILDYRSAADRKIVHMTLEHDDRVYTKSIGAGAGRKLLILPSRGQKKNRFEQEETNVQEEV